MTGALAAFLQDQIPVHTHMVSLFSPKMKSLAFSPVFCLTPATRPQGGNDLFQEGPHPSHSDAVAVPSSQGVFPPNTTAAQMPPQGPQ